MSDMIILKEVTKRFQSDTTKKNSRKKDATNATWFTAVQPTSLSIRQGEIFGLMGYSGAGKSTLLRLINLLERPDSGQVIIDGEDLTALSASQLRVARHNIGMIFQQFNLMANRTVFDNVAFNLKVSGYPASQINERVQACLDIVDLADRARHYPAQLSGGQKQRVGIARAIAPNPKVLLADEPTSALDPATTRSLLTCLRDINEKLGVTIVIVTHEMSVIRRLCHRVALLHQGELLEVADIHSDTIHATTPIGQGLVLED
ncbi:methionine ABC transporter ATP-binding protein [Psychrobacter sp. I-STPA10]|uniref:methionine ABC transporter ATP-binding protein n=1 Tax=Psychrobacter sp. I-STPA10 TaxID=2585769 RepID=UPI001E29E1A4|nr:methionine ABC transporter ATP-binding protein [Psychrobacter sp. I-STPA10]